MSVIYEICDDCNGLANSRAYTAELYDIIVVLLEK